MNILQYVLSFDYNRLCLRRNRTSIFTQCTKIYLQVTVKNSGTLIRKCEGISLRIALHLGSILILDIIRSSIQGLSPYAYVLWAKWQWETVLLLGLVIQLQTAMIRNTSNNVLIVELDEMKFYSELTQILSETFKVFANINRVHNSYSVRHSHKDSLRHLDIFFILYSSLLIFKSGWMFSHANVCDSQNCLSLMVS